MGNSEESVRMGVTVKDIELADLPGDAVKQDSGDAQLDAVSRESSGAAAAAPLSESERYDLEQREKKRIRDERLQPMKRNFPYFAGLSLFFALAYTFCLYRNPGGITYPLFVAAACLCGVLACRKLGCRVKRGSWFLLAAAMALGIGTCRTAEWFLVAVNGLALVLLGCVFALHQFYNDDAWNLGKYFSAIFQYLFHAVGLLAVPFQHMNSWLGQRENGRMRRAAVFGAGILIAAPVLALLVVLLGQADVVFLNFVREILGLLKPLTILHIGFMVAFGFLAMYCLVGCSLARPVKEETVDRRKGEPLMAIAFMGSIALVYMAFCAIQIFYLFLGKGRLPEGYTYSSYARQGFFQLLFVACLNLVMVLACLKFIRPSRVVNAILTLICGCTYIMLASAVLRMLLYVRVYHLTYLRLTTLWFMAMLAVLLPGVALVVWRPKFHLFRFGLAVVTVFYIGLVWAKPGEILGWDYVHYLNRAHLTEEDARYLLHELSADAAPAIAAMQLTGDEVEKLDWRYHGPQAEVGLAVAETAEAEANGAEMNGAETDGKTLDGADTNGAEVPNAWMEWYYNQHAGSNYRKMGLRNYNFALAKVKALIPGGG